MAAGQGAQPNICAGGKHPTNEFYEANKFRCHYFYFREIIEKSIVGDFDQLHQFEKELENHNQLCEKCAKAEDMEKCPIVHTTSTGGNDEFRDREEKFIKIQLNKVKTYKCKECAGNTRFRYDIELKDGSRHKGFCLECALKKDRKCLKAMVCLGCSKHIDDFYKANRYECTNDYGHLEEELRKHHVLCEDCASVERAIYKKCPIHPECGYHPSFKNIPLEIDN